MLTHDRLRHQARAFRGLCGMDSAHFEELHADFAAAEGRVRGAKTRKGLPRRRAAGAGRKPSLDSRTRLLLGLVWLRAYPTFAALGVLFGLDGGNAQRDAEAVVAVLESLGDLPFDRPDPERPRLASLAAVMDAFPDVRLVIDTKEQRCRRPGGDFEAQKPYYSMKKKAHTLKTQIAVRPDGRVESAGDPVPGGSKHDKTVLRESGLIERLPEGEGFMADKAYDSLREERPEVPIVTPRPARRGHPLTEGEKVANRFIARYRIVVEHAIAQLTTYTVLRQVWRGGRSAHGGVMRAIAHLINRRIDRTPLKSYAA